MCCHHMLIKASRYFKAEAVMYKSSKQTQSPIGRRITAELTGRQQEGSSPLMNWILMVMFLADVSLLTKFSLWG